jgi:CubicO group peptidase (beta-lactamase class C family)
MLLRPVLAVIIAMVSLTSSAGAQQSLKDFLEPIAAKYGLPALAAAVAKEGRIVAIGAVGTRLLGADIPVTVDDRFHIGSDTKAMTATLVGILIDKGKLNWTSTIADVLGPVMPKLKPNFAALTLERLLSHSSGLPTDNDEIGTLYFGSGAYDMTSPEYRRHIIGVWGAKHEPARAGEWPFMYSNLGYIVVGAMIEQVTGEPWENLIQKQIFEPLGLTTAGLGPQATMGLYDAPVGHAVDAQTGKVTPHPWGPSADAPAVLGPAGIAHMSVGDFAKWAAWNAGEGKRGPAIVKPETLKRLHTAHVEMAIADPKPGTPKSGAYGFGWGLVKFGWSDRPLLTHNGSNGMNLATILVDPANDIAIAIATNFPGEKADAALLETTRVLYGEFGPAAAFGR